MSDYPIYMDAMATTRVDPRVLEAMLPFFTESYGNPSNEVHSFGKEASAAVESSRKEIAIRIHAKPEEILFTSGATESNNLALKGVARLYREKGNHIISTQTEHPSVLEPLKSLEHEGFEVTYLPVNQYGQILIEDLKKAITPKTILISVMAANNEVGTLNALAQIGAAARRSGIFFHTDAAQAVGKIPIDVDAMKIDLMSFSSHKFYGPKGVGGLYLRKVNPRVRLEAQIEGGGQERELRSGTLNVPGIVGMGEALKWAVLEMDRDNRRIAALRDKLAEGLESRLDEIQFNGHPAERLTGNLSVSFGYIEGETLLKELSSKVALSMGSACATDNVEPSYVLEAMGIGPDRAQCTVRFGLGRFNTEKEVERVIEAVAAAVKRLRADSPLYSVAKEGLLN